jgi:hypothetical protein
MLGSAEPGERANAAALADRFVRDQGLTWSEVFGISPTSQLIAEALACQYELTEREVAFLRNAAGYDSLSPKQQEWLDRIVAKVRLLREAA